MKNHGRKIVTVDCNLPYIETEKIIKPFAHHTSRETTYSFFAFYWSKIHIRYHLP